MDLLGTFAVTDAVTLHHSHVASAAYVESFLRTLANGLAERAVAAQTQTLTPMELYAPKRTHKCAGLFCNIIILLSCICHFVANTLLKPVKISIS